MKLTVNGKEEDVVELDFEIKKEEWNEYILLDGGSCRVRLVVSKIFRVLDENGQPSWNQDGSPNIAINSGNMLVSKA